MVRALLFLASALLCASQVAPVLAQRSNNPFDQEARQLERSLTRARSTGAAMVSLLQLASMREDASPGTIAAALDRIARQRRVPAPVRVRARFERAFLSIDEGDPAAAERALNELGYVRDWQIIGPFDNEGRAGWDATLPPEAGQSRAVDRSATHRGRERDVGWRLYPQSANRYGYVDFDSMFRPWVHVCGFAETFVHSDRARALSVWLGAGGAAKVLVNGTEVVRDDVYRSPGPDRVAGSVRVHAGWNRVLVKSCVTEGGWGFYLRFGDTDGSPVEGLRFDPEGSDQAIAAVDGATPNAPSSALRSLEAAVADGPERAAPHYQLAELLRLDDADDPDEEKARQLADRAVELDETLDHLELAAALSPTRSERMRYTERAEAIAANDPRTRLLRAALMASGPDPGRALRMLDMPMTTTSGMRAAMRRARMLRGRGLERTAMSIVRAGLERSGGATRWVRRYLGALNAAGRREESLAQRRRLLELAWGDVQSHRVLLDDAIERGETDLALAQIDALRSLYPGSPSILREAATVFEGMGRRDDALDIRRELIALTPEEPEYQREYGLALLRFGHRGPAIEAFRALLELRPQDAGARQMLETLRPSRRPDEAYATAIEEILERRQEQSRWPAVILHDLSVNTVFESGLSTEYRQIAYQVHDAESARRWGTYAIPFQPGIQYVDVQSARVHRADGTVAESVRTSSRRLGDPRYRIYYDTRVLRVHMPELQPGDTVELRYRVEDLSRRNEFNDYYGAFRILQRAQPVKRLEHILIAPRSRELHVRAEMQGLQHEQRDRGSNRVHRYVASDIPALRSEPRMPGAAEVAPYLHVSTYASWEDVGRWWWGLARDQLRPDDALRETVRELVDGVTDTREKVERIYNWVVRNTRYVGLEFGIHGFKPYRVTQVVQRGFGDCKDKASLLYAMLTLAGVEARIALIRTRRNGRIETSPASLAVFDHAIAYVPELQLFLDGTAETHGVDELPYMDQGTMTLIVGPESVELAQTPVLAPDRETWERTLDVRLEADGAAAMRVEERLVGSNAAAHRTRYESTASRNERLQRSVAGTFPGIEIENERFSDLSDFEAAVTVSYDARVPQFATSTGSGLELATSTISGLTRRYAPSPNRRHPLEVGVPSRYVETRRIRLPRGTQVEHLPPGGTASSPYGSFEVEVERRDSTIEIQTTFELRRPAVPVGEYDAFRQWVERADALARQRITLGGGR